MFRLFSDGKPRLGLALSGGGARGFAHCGAIQAMEEMGLKPDVVSGVSAGSVVAVMYASGMSPDDILKAFGEMAFSDFAQLSVPKSGFFKLDGMKKFLRKHVPYERIEDLPIPTYIGATDLDLGTPVVLDKGNIADCVAASCSIPIVFQPQRIDGHRYIDGGVLRNLPAWAIRDKCRVLFGVNVSPIIHEQFKDSIMDIAIRSYNLLAKNNAVLDMELCDLVIETSDIAHYKIFDLRGIRRVYSAGYNAAVEKLIEAGFQHPGLKKMKRKSSKK